MYNKIARLYTGRIKKMIFLWRKVTKLIYNSQFIEVPIINKSFCNMKQVYSKDITDQEYLITLDSELHTKKLV